MESESTFLQSLIADPADSLCWLALADWLEEHDQTERSEVLRLRLELQSAEVPQRRTKEQRMRRLLATGIIPPTPVVANCIGMRLALIPAGTFWMGSVEDEPGRHRDESPQHQTTLSKPFFLGITPVTQEQFFRVMGQQPSHFREEGYRATFVRKLPTHSFPVENISWGDAERFCHELSNLPEEQEAGRVYRLPTEAEWEYAARAGTTTMFHFGDGLSSEQANINGGTPYNAPKGRFLERPCPVGLFPANAFGLHDMHGNVWEWCSDWFQTHVYTNSVRIDPRGPTRGDRRVLRGGSWFYGALISRSAYRYRFEPGERNDDFGMRVAMDIVR